MPPHYIILLSLAVHSHISRPLEKFIQFLFWEYHHGRPSMRAGVRIVGPCELLQELPALVRGAVGSCLDRPATGNNPPDLLPRIDPLDCTGGDYPGDNIPYLTGFDVLSEQHRHSPEEKGAGTERIDQKPFIREQRERSRKSLALPRREGEDHGLYRAPGHRVPDQSVL